MVGVEGASEVPGTEIVCICVCVCMYVCVRMCRFCVISVGELLTSGLSS